MCLLLYVATSGEQACFETDVLKVEEVDPARESVRQWLSLPVVRFVGAHTGCSCGFESVIANEPFEFYEGMFEYDKDNEDDLRSMQALVALIRQHVARDGRVELFPVWDGDEPKPPLGTIEKRLSALQPETWFFVQHFLYRVTADPP